MSGNTVDEVEQSSTKRVKLETLDGDVMTFTIMNELEHILERPDTQVGSIDNKTIDHSLVWDFQANAFAMRDNLVICPALGKLIDEPLVNVADHKTRFPDLVKKCKVTINVDTGEISIWNDGPGIPVKIHPDWDMYVVQGIFGNLRSSSNFDDTQERFTGGRNGYGAKLCNIFSTQFTVETCDGQKKYKQTWTKNMSVVGKPSVRTMKSDNPKTFTKLSFVPDWTRFGDGVDGWSDDMLCWISTRCVELAGTKPKLEMTLELVKDGQKTTKKVPIKGFKAFSQAVSGTLVPDLTFSFCYVNTRWKVGLAPSDGTRGVCHSYVNSIATPNEGTHVRHVRNQIVKAIKQKLKKDYKSLRASNGMIEAHLLLFVNCMVPNPTFGSQTKEELTLPATKFGVKCTFTDAQLSKLIKDTGIVDLIAERSRGTKHEESKFDDAKKSRTVHVDKLEDAVSAGGSKSLDCTLILTEGDSAKALAVAGLAVVGRQKYGVFPLRGVPLNVRQATHDQIKANAEIQNIILIMGLRQNVDYRDPKVRATLRYGHLVIMADQDDDGTHIKSLIVNFIAVFNKTLLSIPFLSQFVTPVMRARKKKLVKSFYSVPEFTKWSKTVDVAKWDVKYYKGLGTSTASEAREYFRDLDRHLIPFDTVDIDQRFVSLIAKYAPKKQVRGKRRKVGTSTVKAEESGGASKVEEDGDDSGETLDLESWNGLQWMEMVFEKDLSDLRKQWLTQVPAPTGEVPIEKLGQFAFFFTTAYRLYCQASILRAIPSVFDGFKPSQRKILYMALTRNNKEIKVEAFSGQGQERVNYHHGAVSLQDAMIRMAQNFPGSNNLNLLSPVGQFGTRLEGGKDSASARYIFTKLDPVARAVFPAADDPVLTYQHEEGMDIEPYHYMPVIPMSLVNGSSGLATGWSSQIPTFNPLDLIDVTEAYLDTGVWDTSAIKPYVRGFTGVYNELDSSGPKDLIVSNLVGSIRMVDSKTLVITELPPGKWVTPFIKFARTNVVHKGGKEPDEVRTMGTETTVDIHIILHKDTVAYYAQKKNTLTPIQFEELLVKDWNLASKVSMRTTMAYLLNKDNQVTGYTIDTILETHAEARLAMYEKRKQSILDSLTVDMDIWTMKAKFLHCLLDDTLVVRKRPLADIQADMTGLGFDEKDHDMLLTLPLKVQTKEMVDAWETKVVKLKEEFEVVSGMTVTEFWKHDLKVLRKAVQQQNADLLKSRVD